MQKIFRNSMRDINSQIKLLDKELDHLVICELRKQRFFILSTYLYFFKNGYFTGSFEMVESAPEKINYKGR